MRNKLTFSYRQVKPFTIEERKKLTSTAFEVVSDALRNFETEKFVIKKDEGTLYVNIGEVTFENSIIIPPVKPEQQIGEVSREYAGIGFAVLSCFKALAGDKISIKADFVPEVVFGEENRPSLLDVFEYVNTEEAVFKSRTIAEMMAKTLEKELSECTSFQQVKKVASRYGMDALMASGTKAALISSSQIVGEVAYGEQVKLQTEKVVEELTKSIDFFGYNCGMLSAALVKLKALENEEFLTDDIDREIFELTGSANFKKKDEGTYLIYDRSGKIPVGEIKVDYDKEHMTMKILEVNRFDGVSIMQKVKNLELGIEKGADISIPDIGKSGRDIGGMER